VKRRLLQLLAMMRRQSPYPLAVQGGVMLVLLAVPLSAWGSVDPDLALYHYWVLTILVGLHLLMVALVPAHWLPDWARLVYLAIQAALTVAAQALYPVPLMHLVYLVVVLQSIALLRPLFWIPFAVSVWALWSGLVLIASMSLWAWLQSNLAIAFPALCAIVAVIVYARHRRGSEQAQQVLQQVQQRYDALATALRDMQQLAVLEERQRLTQSLASELQTALVQVEQLAGYALEQTQTNLSRLQATVAQTRAAATTAIERLRGTVAALRHDEFPYQNHPIVERLSIGSNDELVVATRANRVLTWVLPSVFAVAALILLGIGQEGIALQIGLVQIVLVLLVLLYVCTQYVQRTLLIQAGLLGQVFALVLLVLTTGMPLVWFGLLLILWQMVLRLSPIQMVLSLLLALVPFVPIFSRLDLLAPDLPSLLMVLAALVVVGGPLLVARRYLSRRRQVELQVALLEAEVEQQTFMVRKLASGAERARLAREFHDDLGSRLMLLNLQLQLAEELVLEDPPEALVQLQNSREQIRAAWKSLLQVIDSGLPVQGADLPQALQELVARCRQLTPASVELKLDGALTELSDPLACTIYRVVQEGLANACKHAQPAWIETRVVIQAGYVTVAVRNDAALASRLDRTTIESGGFGLIGLRERAEALGGGIEARMLADGTYRLRVVLPVEHDPPEVSKTPLVYGPPALSEERSAGIA
jgi:signal transduction histidine kinase